jgi:hypothetical protein
MHCSILVTEAASARQCVCFPDRNLVSPELFEFAMKAALAAFLGHVGALILDEMPVAFAQTIGILALNVLPLLIRGLLIVVDFGG